MKMEEIYKEKGIRGIMEFMNHEAKTSECMSSLAKHIGVSRQSLYNIFSSKNTPKTEYLFKMLEFFGYKFELMEIPHEPNINSDNI